MANEIVSAKALKLAIRGESALGTGTGSWEDLRLVDAPNIPTATRKLIPNHVLGHRNPLTREKPVSYETYMENAFTLKQHIRRASADGAPSLASKLFQSAGWQEDVGNNTTVTTATASVVGMTAAGSMAVGKAFLVAVGSTYRPALINSIATLDVSPTIPLSAAPSDGAVVEPMYVWTPTTLTGYQVPTDKTIQFRMNCLGKDDDAIGDLSFILSACAAGELASIEIGGNGTAPTLDWGIHVGDIAPFLVVNGDAEFAFASTNAGSAIGTLVTKMIDSITITTGLKVIPIIGVGGSGVINGIQGYMLQQEAPTIKVVAKYRGDSAFEKNWRTELEDDNTRKYIHFIQPCSDLNYPAFGVWMPNCHIMDEGEPMVTNLGGDIIQTEVTFQATNAELGGETAFDELAASPIYIGISGEHSA
jgi:hypothetical protein